MPCAHQQPSRQGRIGEALPRRERREGEFPEPGRIPRRIEVHPDELERLRQAGGHREQFADPRGHLERRWSQGRPDARCVDQREARYVEIVLMHRSPVVDVGQTEPRDSPGTGEPPVRWTVAVVVDEGLLDEDATGKPAIQRFAGQQVVVLDRDRVETRDVVAPQAVEEDADSRGVRRLGDEPTSEVRSEESLHVRAPGTSAHLEDVDDAGHAEFGAYSPDRALRLELVDELALRARDRLDHAAVEEVAVESTRVIGPFRQAAVEGDERRQRDPAVRERTVGDEV